MPMQARKGRASYLGERSVGHQDPGATSAALIVARARSAPSARRADGRAACCAGLPASPGMAVGRARRARRRAGRRRRRSPAAERRGELERARAALAAAGASSRRSPRGCAPTAARRGRDRRDRRADGRATRRSTPTSRRAVLRDGRAAPAALVAACRAPRRRDRRARRRDARRARRRRPLLGRRAARSSRGRTAGRRATGPAPAADVVLVADDLGPADVAELDAGVAGDRARRAAAPTAHAAVVARGLGHPDGRSGSAPALLDAAPARRSWSTARPATRSLAPDAGARRRARRAARARGARERARRRRPRRCPP